MMTNFAYLALINNKLSHRSLRSLYYALVHSHFLYCNTILNCTSAKNLSKIQKTTKKAIRIITKSKSNEHTGPLFLDQKILPFELLSLQSKLTFMHAVHYKYAPPSFYYSFIQNVTRDIEYDLRNAGAYAVPAVRIEFFKHFPLYTRTFRTAWNGIGDLQFYSNRTTFLISLKDNLL